MSSHRARGTGRRRSGLGWHSFELLEERRLLAAVPVLVAGAAPGGAPHVLVLDAQTGQQRFDFLAYGAVFGGGVRVATGDVNGDGADDIITAAGTGGGPHVRVFSGVDGSELRSFFAYSPDFTGGVFVAAGDVNGDGKADIITGAGAGGGPHVRVFSGADGSELRSFFAYSPGFGGGVQVAAGDVNGDRKADIITGAGAGGGPHVRVFSGADGSELASFFAYTPSFLGGVNVAAVDLNGDGRADIVTGAGAGGGPHVRAIDSVSGSTLASFFAFDANYTGGVVVAAAGGRIFAGGNPGGVPLARTFNSAGGLQGSFSSLGADFQRGMYVAGGVMPLESSGPRDDVFEENDTLAQASDLGALTATRTLDGLHLLDAADWFRFHITGTGNPSSYVRIDFTHSLGDIDLGLYNSSGTLVRRSDGTANSEQISLDGLAGGDYFVKVYGYQGVHNPNYSLTINPTTSTVSGSTMPGRNVLYVNFDGATITSADLNRWAANQWSPAWLPGATNGVTVNPFFAGRSDREQIISGILSYLQADLAPFGITVQRHTGLAVENVGATTVFAGNSTLTHPHVACDVDYGNDNRTDIAFVGDENWGSVASTSLAMSDVFLHEAGHTYGLFHVETVQNGTLYPESMGLRYSSDQSQWLEDTSFMDRTFIEFRDADGNWHGPGGGTPQNSYRTMLANLGGSGGSGSGSTGNLAAVDSSQPGVLSITASSAADQIQIVQQAGGVVDISINNQHYTVGGLQKLVIDTLGDTRDQLQTVGKLGFQLFVNPGASCGAWKDAKLDTADKGLWNGTSLSQPGHGGGCSCPMCQGALDNALARGIEVPLPVLPKSGPSQSSDGDVFISQVVAYVAANSVSSDFASDLAAHSTDAGDALLPRTVDEMVFDLERLDDLLAAAQLI